MSEDLYAERRRQMVDDQLAARGIADPAVLEAMGSVPRHAFVLPENIDLAYEDGPLPIGEGQTISQPYIVALMTEALQLCADDRVLEIGTGSGYAAAVLSCIAKQVYTVERLGELVRRARDRLCKLGYHNVHAYQANGTLGWPAQAPYDAIVVTAGGPQIPDLLKEQLAVGGRLVMPVGKSPTRQNLIRLTRLSKDTYREENLGAVCFVPLIGAQGWGAQGWQAETDERPSG